MNENKRKDLILRRIGWVPTYRGYYVNSKLHLQVKMNKVKSMSLFEVIDIFVDDTEITSEEKRILLFDVPEYFEQTKTKTKVK
jgi:hypothetical protein